MYVIEDNNDNNEILSWRFWAINFWLDRKFKLPSHYQFESTTFNIDALVLCVFHLSTYVKNVV